MNKIKKSFLCPEDQSRFCKVKNCNDYCGRKGVCINGKCMYLLGEFGDHFSINSGDPFYAGVCEV